MNRRLGILRTMAYVYTCKARTVGVAIGLFVLRKWWAMPDRSGITLFVTQRVSLCIQNDLAWLFAGPIGRIIQARGRVHRLWAARNVFADAGLQPNQRIFS